MRGAAVISRYLSIILLLLFSSYAGEAKIKQARYVFSDHSSISLPISENQIIRSSDRSSTTVKVTPIKKVKTRYRTLDLQFRCLRVSSFPVKSFDKGAKYAICNTLVADRFYSSHQQRGPPSVSA
jgi:hypothetical protein